MIREVLRRPGRLRMRLTVVAAASALFALVVLAALVLPSLQHNLEQSRVASLHASVDAFGPDRLLGTFGHPQPVSRSDLQTIAGTLGVARITVFAENGLQLSPISDTSDAALDRKTLSLVAQSANLHSDITSVTNLHGGRTAVLAFPVSNGGMEGVVLVQAPLSDVQQQVSAVERRLVFGGALAFGVALLAGALAAEPLARRLARLRAAADRIARGSFDEPIVDHKGDEIGELARSLDEMRSRLDALERARSAFIANASHELRTPLTALGGYLELLTEGGLTEAEREEFLETMGEQVQRLTKLATDLLDLSRLDAGGFTVSHDELELGELASDAAREMQALAARRGSAVVAEPGTPAGRGFRDAAPQSIDVACTWPGRCRCRVFHPVQTLERQENLLCILGIEASPVIGDRYGPFLRAPQYSYLDIWWLRRAPELQRVADQVSEIPTQGGPIPVTDGKGPHCTCAPVASSSDLRLVSAISRGSCKGMTAGTFCAPPSWE